MKKQMLKLTMLLLAIVFGGSSALAQLVNFERNSASAWTSEDVTDWGGSTLSVTSNGLTVNSKATVFGKKGFTFNDGTKVTLVAQLLAAKDHKCKTATAYDYFKCGGFTLKVFRVNDKYSGKIDIDGNEYDVNVSNNGTFKITLVFNQADKSLSYMVGDKTCAYGSVTYNSNLSEVEFGFFAEGVAPGAAVTALKTLSIREEESPSAISLPLSTDYTYSTYTTDWGLDFTDVTDIEAYTVTVEGATVLTKKINGKVRAGEGILIKNVGGVDKVSIPVATGASKLENNNLVGVLNAVSFEKFFTNISGKAYILTSDTEFQLITSASKGNLAKGKAFLLLPAETAAKSLFFGEATGINGVAVEKKADNAIYNLQGMRVKTPTKGLYIINGKKYRF